MCTYGLGEEKKGGGGGDPLFKPGLGKKGSKDIVAILMSITSA